MHGEKERIWNEKFGTPNEYGLPNSKVVSPQGTGRRNQTLDLLFIPTPMGGKINNNC